MSQARAETSDGNNALSILINKFRILALEKKRWKGMKGGKLLKADRLSSESEGNYCTKEDLGSICKYLIESLFLSCFKAVFYLCFYVCTWVSLCVAHLLKEASGDQTPWNCKLPSTRLWSDK